MTAITNDMRKNVVTKAVAFAMEKDYLALDAMKTKFANAWYEKHFGKEAQQMLSFPFSNKWLYKTHELKIVGEGFTHKHYAETFECMHGEFKFSQEVPLPVGGCGLRIEKGEKRPKDLDAIFVKYQELWNKKERLQSEVRAVMQTVNTYKQMKATWPDGMRFLPTEKVKNRAVITVGTVAALNSAIGLPPVDE